MSRSGISAVAELLVTPTHSTSRLVFAALQATGLLRHRHVADIGTVDEALFERMQNVDRHVLRLLMPPKTELITKTSTLSTNHYLIRMLYTDSY